MSAADLNGQIEISADTFMGRMVRDFDWSATSIGPLPQWPDSLKEAINWMLSSPRPLLFWWGDELIQFCNDACLATLGERLPLTLGQRAVDCWKNVWHTLGPRIAIALSARQKAGPGAGSFPFLQALGRGGRSYSYSPGRLADLGGAIGVFADVGDAAAEWIAAVALMEGAPQQAVPSQRPSKAVKQGARKIRGASERAFSHSLDNDKISRIYQHWIERLHPDDRETAWRELWLAIDGTGDLYEALYRELSPANGEIRWIEVKATIVRDDRRRAIRLVGVQTDITEHIHLTQSEPSLVPAAGVPTNISNDGKDGRRDSRKPRARDRIWTISHDMLATATRAGSWQSFNPAWTSTVGWSEEQLRAPGVEALVHPDDRLAFRQAFALLEHGQAAVQVEVRFRRQDRAYCWLNWTMQRDDDLIYAAARDVSDEKAYMDRIVAIDRALRRSLKMEALGQLTGGIAHDFNNIFTSIVSALDLLQVKIDRGQIESAKRYIDAAMDSTKRAADLAHRLQQFSRRQPESQHAVDVRQLVLSRKNLLRRTFGSRLSFRIANAHDGWLTRCDPAALEGALLRIVLSARDAVADDGALTISVRNRVVKYVPGRQSLLPPGEYISLGICDTGEVAMDAVRQQVIGPMHRPGAADQISENDLSMIAGFVRQSSGYAVIRRRPGVGTTVELNLPRCRDDANETVLDIEAHDVQREGNAHEANTSR